jgi:predicted N-formylglutamate amidohydrolase
VVTCEHASRFIPPEYGNLGLSERELHRHIGWDIGARAVAEIISRELDAPAVLASYSRLLIDCNRDLDDDDLIVAESDGTPIPGNLAVSLAEREVRVQRFYRPYHRAIDGALDGGGGRRAPSLLLSVHSFTPVLGAERRDFDVGVLFDEHEGLAVELGRGLARAGLRTRYNEPYSGEAGLIFSARCHGRRRGLAYLELEINQALVGSAAGAEAVGRSVVCALTDLAARVPL